MPVLQVVSSAPRVGKTAVAVGIAQGLARAGQRVTLARTGKGAEAEADARTFTRYLFATSAGRVLAATEVAAKEGETLIVEPDAGEPLDVPAVLVVRGQASEGDVALAQKLGERLVGTIATCVTEPKTEEVARQLTDAGLRPIALLPEDYTLAAPSVADVAAALSAEVLFEGENWDEAIGDLVVAPIYTDPARPHFNRFGAKAIITPYYKTDLLLAALESEPVCVIATGGGRPIHYVIDRAQHSPTTVLLSTRPTLESVNELADTWTAGRFQGERKAEAIARLMEGRVDFASLARKLS